MYAAPNAAGWSETQRLLRRMNDETRAAGGEFVLDLLPLLVDARGDYPFQGVSREVRRACGEAGITFHDARPALADRPARDYQVHPVDFHPNERAHARIAEDIAPLVAAALARRAASR
jgi:hypothetical protein